MKKIVLGVCSSVSVYKSCELARKFIKKGYRVNVVMTKNATKFVTPLTFQSLTGNQVFSGKFFKNKEERMPHIELRENTDLMIISPATADIIGKMANGIADDILSTSFLAAACPVIVAPAMNPNMWNHPAVQTNVKKLKEWGVTIIEPEKGEVACGVVGKGRLADTTKILQICDSKLEVKKS